MSNVDVSLLSLIVVVAVVGMVWLIKEMRA